MNTGDPFEVPGRAAHRRQAERGASRGFCSYDDAGGAVLYFIGI